MGVLINVTLWEPDFFQTAKTSVNSKRVLRVHHSISDPAPFLKQTMACQKIKPKLHLVLKSCLWGKLGTINFLTSLGTNYQVVVWSVVDTLTAKTGFREKNQEVN